MARPEEQQHQTASDALAQINKGRVGSLAGELSLEYMQALRRELLTWASLVEDRMRTYDYYQRQDQTPEV